MVRVCVECGVVCVVVVVGLEWLVVSWSFVRVGARRPVAALGFNGAFLARVTTYEVVVG